MFLLPGGAEKALTDAIHAANPLAGDVHVDDLYFGLITKSADQSGAVEVPVVAMYNSDFEGYIRFKYDRLDLGRAYQGIKPQVKRVGYPTLYRLLPIINETLGLSLTERDVVDVAITWLGENEQVNIPIVSKPDSLGYEGQFLVEYTRVRPELASIANRILDVLKHPLDPKLGQRSMSMNTWGIDFTDDQASLLTNAGAWRYPDQVRKVMEGHGFFNWPQAPWYSLIVSATSDIPTANKEYTHVIIQPNVSYPNHIGDAYFHYNRS
jgi:hypothetical protein